MLHSLGVATATVCAACLQAGAYPFSRPEDERLPAPQRMHVMLQVCCVCASILPALSQLQSGNGCECQQMPQTRQPGVEQHPATIAVCRYTSIALRGPQLVAFWQATCSVPT
jgi:ectoine hydroxylase-related dioxygenase (phytanoyl-CoA dioxygenase family)